MSTFRIITPAGPARHPYQAPDRQTARVAAELAGEIVIEVTEITITEGYGQIPSGYTGPLTPVITDAEAPAPVRAEPEETERDRAAGLGPDHDRLTLHVSYRDDMLNSFGLGDTLDDQGFPWPATAEAYLAKVRERWDLDEAITWVIAEDLQDAQSAQVTFIAPRGVLEHNIVAMWRQ